MQLNKLTRLDVPERICIHPVFKGRLVVMQHVEYGTPANVCITVFRFEINGFVKVGNGSGIVF